MKNFKNIFYVSVLSLALFACDQEKANIDAEGPGSTSNKSTVTATPDNTGGDVNEGDVVTFSITLDKPQSSAVGFEAILVGGSGSADDVVLGSSRVGSYATGTSITVEFAADLIPENDETVIVKIVPDGVVSGYFVSNPDNLGEYTYNVKSPVDPDDLIVALEWDTVAAHDLDMFSVSAANGAWDQQWTGDHPEVKNLIWGVDPDGTYYLGIDPYDVEAGVDSFWYRWSLGQPDGTITVIEGMFDYANRDTAYTIDSATGGTPSYRLVTIEKAGLNFAATGL